MHETELSKKGLKSRQPFCTSLRTWLVRKMASALRKNPDVLTACRLIPLDKKLACRPIAIGKGRRRIIGKYITEVTKDNILEASRSVRGCAGRLKGDAATVPALG